MQYFTMNIRLKIKAESFREAREFVQSLIPYSMKPYVEKVTGKKTGEVIVTNSWLGTIWDQIKWW